MSESNPKSKKKGRVSSEAINEPDDEDCSESSGITLDEVEGQKIDAWSNLDVVGFYCYNDHIPNPDDVEYEAWIEDESRIEELENGGELTEEEKERFRKVWLEKYFGGDSMTHFGLVMLQGRVASLFSSGCSWEGISVWVGGVYDSWEEAFEHLDKNGVRNFTTFCGNAPAEVFEKYGAEGDFSNMTK